MRVFLSSTQTDLEAEREIVYYALTGAGHEVVRMEDFGSRGPESWKVCLKELERCDGYVLLIGRRYGSILEDTGLSYSHAEYELAQIKGIPTLAYVEEGLPEEDDSEDARRLREFVELVNKAHQVRRPYFRIKELGELVKRDVANAEAEGPPSPPEFHRTPRPIADPERYAVARAERDLLGETPYSLVIADLHVLASLKYPDEVPVRLRNKALQLRADLLHRSIDAKILNEIEVDGSGIDEILTKRVAWALRANALVVLIQQRGDLPLLDEHFPVFSGTKIVCYPSAMHEPTVPRGTRLLRYTPHELNSCNLVAEVHRALAPGIDDYVLSIAA
jgi:hypothetical protein